MVYCCIVSMRVTSSNGAAGHEHTCQAGYSGSQALSTFSSHCLSGEATRGYDEVRGLGDQR